MFYPLFYQVFFVSLLHEKENLDSGRHDNAITLSECFGA